MKTYIYSTLPLAAFLAAAPLSAQELQSQIRIHRAGVPAAAADNVQFVTSEMSFSDKVVKGFPYSADTVTETTQTLADGNTIVHTNSSRIFRDSQGRTRREQSLGALGPWQSSNNPAPMLISIYDPVAGLTYNLNPEQKTADKLTPANVSGGTGADAIQLSRALSSLPSLPPPGGPAAPGKVFFFSSGAGPALSKPVSESLGSQVIEGVTADGTRTTTVIPAGQIGNTRDITIVNESWYSPELQQVVLSKRSDPMAGNTVYKLTNISRAEPSSTLFQVPADYTVSEQKGAMVWRRDRKPE